jgi:hypothetical protein
MAMRAAAVRCTKAAVGQPRSVAFRSFHQTQPNNALLISGDAAPRSTIFDRVGIFLVGAGAGGGGGYYMLSQDMEKNTASINAALDNLTKDQKSSIAKLNARVGALEKK